VGSKTGLDVLEKKNPALPGIEHRLNKWAGMTLVSNLVRVVKLRMLGWARCLVQVQKETQNCGGKPFNTFRHLVPV
jgi:hypothetical protein